MVLKANMPALPDSKVKTAITVLGNQLNPDGSAPSVLLVRVNAAAEYFKHFKKGSAILVVSGGDSGKAGVTEAFRMREILI
jgi:hypothetical protein